MNDTTDRMRMRPAVAVDGASLLALDLAAWTPGSGFPSALGAGRATFFAERNTPRLHLRADYRGGLVEYVRLQENTGFPRSLTSWTATRPRSGSMSVMATSSEGRYVDEFLIDGEFVDDLTMAKMLGRGSTRRTAA